MDVATTIVGGLGALALALGGLVVRGLRNDITALESSVQKLTVNVGILLDRDRRRRLEDYEQQESD